MQRDEQRVGVDSGGGRGTQCNSGCGRSSMTQQQLQDLRELFQLYDSDGDGMIDLDELTQVESGVKLVSQNRYRWEWMQSSLFSTISSTDRH